MNKSESVDMGKYSGFGCGGRARRLYEVENRKELQKLISSLKTNNGNYYILGGGYNTLIAGGEIDTVVIMLKKEFSEISVSGEILSAGAGASLGELLKISSEKNLSGLEFLSGVPGTVGGALSLNAGTAKSYIGDLVRDVEILNTEKITIENLKKNDFAF
ncbi:MAG: FAD-binding protein, partial [Elusimicrobiota bacterium]|nr:FAD-binding protein [Elusimicrobiota bacterium]